MGITTTEYPTGFPTTSYPTPSEESEPTPDSGSWPTPRPTLKSAMKWEMIHPAYSGSDGELLWHVYYGDFSDDERFDEFRADEKWDAQEIRPIIQAGGNPKFIKYASGNKLFDEQIIDTANSHSAPS